MALFISHGCHFISRYIEFKHFNNIQNMNRHVTSVYLYGSQRVMPFTLIRNMFYADFGEFSS